MKKIFKTVCVALLLAVSVTLVACNGATTLWETNFGNGNQGVFGTYGQVTDNKEQGYVRLTTNAGENYSASTYFGQNDTKNYNWEKGGFTVSLTVGVDSEELSAGKYSVWSLALNETDGKYVTEMPTFFMGGNDGVYFLYKFTGVENDYNALIKDENAVKIDNGKYTVNYIFSANAEDEIILKVTLENENNQEVFKSENNKITAIDHEGYTSESILKQSNVKGLRYLWLARTNAPVNVYKLKISK